MREIEAIEYQWPYFEQYLPELEQSATSFGALVRRRGIQSGSILLRLAMVYGFCGFSLRETAAWAASVDLAAVSDVALLKRFRSTPTWLGHLLGQKILDRARLHVPANRAHRIRLVDASAVSIPGSKGTDWRIHASVDLARLAIDDLQVTDASVGESLTNFTFAPTDLVIADRGYAHREGLAYVDENKAGFLVRLPLTNVPLEDANAQPFDLIRFLRGLPDALASETSVSFTYRNRRIACRLLALRKTEAAAEQSRRKTLSERKKKGRSIDPLTLEAAGYTFLLCNLPAQVLPADQAFELYRFRWQIELVFKRLKSLVHLDDIRAKEPSLAQTFILAKLLGALLVEDLTSNYMSISPWGYILRDRSLPLETPQGLY